MTDFVKHNYLKEIKGALSAVFLLLVCSSWFGLPQLQHEYTLLKVTALFQSHEVSYRHKADETIAAINRSESDGAKHRQLPKLSTAALVGRLLDGSLTVFFPLGENQDGYLYTVRPLNKRDTGEGGILILSDSGANWTSQPIYVARTLEPQWYYIEQES